MLDEAFADSLCKVIGEQYERQGSWSVSPEHFAALAGLSLAEVYRSLYDLRDRIETIAPRAFGPDNVGDMAALVCAVAGPRAEDLLARAGVVLNHDAHVEIERELLEQADLAVRRHRIDAEEFAAMVRARGSFRRAADTYLGHHFDLGAMAEAACVRFVAGKAFALQDIALENARRYAATLMRRKIVRPEALFATVEERLRRLAGEEPQASVRLDAPLLRALSDMGMASFPPDREALRRQYRVLMKTYHPDVNPRGLSLSQRINAAYALLLGRMQT